MVFSSLTFISIFLPLVFFLHLVLPSIRTKNVLLVVASLLFYAYGEPVYVVLMIVSTFANWLFGLFVAPRASEALCDNGVPTVGKHGKVSTCNFNGDNKRRKSFLAAAVVLNLAFLGVFKYSGMAVESLNAAFQLAIPAPAISLPIGISFYTFQAMSYVIDVYRGDARSQRSFLRVLLYISFFPQLIAGPIVKYHDVDQQLSERHASLNDVALGMRRFIVGLSKKVLIANTMGVVVDSVFSAEVTSVNIAVAWIAALAYLMQIYFDFSGYSDMAIGMARMFGFHFKENFEYPYISSSVKEFWRRWHISLSTWFKEYVYIPLGGNRKGRPRMVFNKMVVFFLCGLWHGAAWTFVVWGLIHGFFLLLEEYLPIRKLPKPLGVAYTLLVACTAFALFRADTFGQGWLFISQMFTGWHFELPCVQLAMRQLSPLVIVTFAVAVVAATPVSKWVAARVEAKGPQTVARVRTASYAGALALLALCVLTLASGGYNPFIYFRF